MIKDKDCILTINGGSSSIKFAFYKAEELQVRLLHGKIDRIGLKDSKLTFGDEKGIQKGTIEVKASDNQSAANFLVDWLEKQDGFSSVRAVGHRVVHGMNHTGPEFITHELLNELHHFIPYEPDSWLMRLLNCFGVKCSDCIIYQAAPGSKSPGLVPIISPPAGVKPMVVSMLFPSKTAARLAPLPRCASITRPWAVFVPAIRASSSIKKA